jgi:hypothetical protein
MTEDDKRIAVYEQDGEFYRHNDNLKWSRFQTIVLLEGGILLGLYQLPLVVSERRLWMIFGFILVAILCLLALKDENDENGHENRMKEFESDVAPFKRVTFPPTPSGTVLMWVTIVLLTVFNIGVLILKWSPTEEKQPNQAVVDTMLRGDPHTADVGGTKKGDAIMNGFAAFLQSQRTCPDCRHAFPIYVDELPSANVLGPKTALRCQCPGCQKIVVFFDGAFTHITNPNALPHNAVHADIIVP